MREINRQLKLSMFNGDIDTAKPIHAWEDESVIKPRLNLYMSEGDKHCFHNNF